MIRWITEHIGTAAWDDVEVAPGLYVLDVRDMVDKSGNSPELIRQKVEQGADKLRRGARVVVCCDYGMSRSNAIAAGILAKTSSMGFGDTVREVLRKTGETAIKIEVLSAVRAVVEPAPASVAANKARCVLVTGGSGFIGSSLLRRLPAEWRVLSPGRSEVDLRTGSVELGLLVREQAVDVLVHLAHPRVVTTNQSCADSLLLLKNVLDACRENDTRLIYLSGWEIFSGYRSCGLLADEQLPVNPSGTYGLAKYLGEILLEQYVRRFGLPQALLRAGPVYGEHGHRPKFITNFIDQAIAGRTITTHRYINGPPCHDLLYVEDFSEALLAVIRNEVTGTFHVGTGTTTSTVEIARMIVELTGSSSQIDHRQIDDFAPNIAMDALRLKRRLGWQPVTDLRSGLRVVIDHFRAQQKLQERGAA